MLDSDKIYPPTSHKLDSLIDQGQIAFSHTAHVALKLSAFLILFILTLSFYKFNSDAYLNYVLNAEVITSKAGYISSLKYLFFVILFFALYSFIIRILQTGFIFFQIKRFPGGILNKKESSYLESLLPALILPLAFVIILSLKYSSFKSNPSLSSTGIDDILYTCSYGLITISLIYALLLTISSKNKFLEKHKMSKAEILQEIRELEGNQEGKKLIKNLIGQE